MREKGPDNLVSAKCAKNQVKDPKRVRKSNMKILKELLGIILRTIIGIGTGLLMAYLGITLLEKVNSLIMGFDPIVVGLVGLAITLVLYFIFVFPYVSCVVPPDKGWVMSNTLKQEDSHPLMQFSGYRAIVAQTEYQAGFHWIYPWEKLATEVDMTRKIRVTHEEVDATGKVVAGDGREKLYTMKEGKRLIRLKYLVLTTALPGNLVNFIKMEERDIILQVQARAEKFLQGFIGNTDAVEFGTLFQERLKTAFQKIYGGKENIDDEERQGGFWTGEPLVYDIDEPTDVQVARELSQSWGVYQKLASDMVEASKGQTSFEQAMSLVLIASGKFKAEYLKFSGFGFDK